MANFRPSLRIRNSCVADHRPHAKNNSAASGRIPSRTKLDGQSAIDSSNVAIESVTSETVAAATTPARTGAVAEAGVVISGAGPAMLIGLGPQDEVLALNGPLTKLGPTIIRKDGPPPRPGCFPASKGGCEMDFEALLAKTPATLEEIRARVYYALERHPLCRGVKFDIVSMPRTSKGNWTISLRSVTPERCGKPQKSSPTSRMPTISAPR